MPKGIGYDTSKDMGSKKKDKGQALMTGAAKRRRGMGKAKGSKATGMAKRNARAAAGASNASSKAKGMKKKQVRRVNSRSY